MTIKDKFWLAVGNIGTSMLNAAVARGVYTTLDDEGLAEEHAAEEIKYERQMHEESFANGYYKGRRDEKAKYL